MSSQKRSEKGIKLRVGEARQRDVGRKIARIDRETMDKLGVSPGDFIEVIGPKGSDVVKVWQAYPEDEGTGLIRIDGMVRKKLGVSPGDYVTVRPISVEPAVKVTIAPIGELPVYGDLSGYIKRQMMGNPVKRGDIIEVPLYGMLLRFAVISTQPSTIVYITEHTYIEVRTEPVRPEVLGEGIPKVTWEDIGDLDEVKQKIREIVELPLKYPELFEHLGIEPPKGILLYGPPGTGKTLLAKALANEIGAYFVTINGPEIMSKFYGESEERLRKIFEEAQANAPAVIFIDEIDSIAPKREEVTGEVEKRVVAQLLTLMDGLKERGKVIVIGATNRPDALDPALRRPGRFDREIEIPPPDKRARREILAVHTRNMPLAEDVDLDKIADMTHGYTGADIAALVKEAAMNALRRFMKEEGIEIEKGQPIPAEKLEKLKVTMDDFLTAMKNVQPSLIREVFVEVPSVHWDDIGGLEDVKQELREAIEWPMKYPHVFEKMGLEPPKGILLFGPPGTGKTLLAKAVATESGANFITVRGPEVLSKWVGESEKAIRQIFRRARMVAPAVVFFDEIDSIAGIRGSDPSGVIDRIVNQLLTELDGIQPLRRVVTIAATNRPDLLDPALLRPGRFDRLVYVPPPDYNARLQIFKVHIRKLPLAEDVSLDELARRTEGYTGADIAAVCREASLIALRERYRSTGTLDVVKVGMEHFIKALERVPPSLSKSDIEMYERLAKELKRVSGSGSFRRVSLPYG
ncbi:Cell division control protein 48, AAA family [Desulfurococcus amylolyticus 1221n]|uniref:Cell division control protein 48, AAA family n=1 Tax=Desulfurococcus amylolyticus (strain DSM 18924 / JCM 16383 / VKM B-2413 / 1221n) TaxID=490899 RepID=B8D3A0_DESA1|nr:CDC48 family AAA ATPase [Desulfurococcus amylolyticus]ACL10371.1 Cell division control protein 48, AAA family [Desulfurococcus amylolyticus 1221n]